MRSALEWWDKIDKKQKIKYLSATFGEDEWWANEKCIIGDSDVLKIYNKKIRR